MSPVYYLPLYLDIVDVRLIASVKSVMKHHAEPHLLTYNLKFKVKKMN